MIMALMMSPVAFANEDGNHMNELYDNDEVVYYDDAAEVHHGEDSVRTGGEMVVLHDIEAMQPEIDEALEIMEEYPVRLILNGEEILFENDVMSPIIIQERTLIPARIVFEAMGGNVVWNEERKEVEVTFGESKVLLTVGSNLAWVGDTARVLDVPAMIVAPRGEIYGNTMIPVRFTAEGLGSTVTWNEDDRIVSITSPTLPDIDYGDENANGYENLNGYENANEEINNGQNDINAGMIHGMPQLPMLNAAAAQRLIVIDPGHGGSDPGAIGGRGTPQELFEKDITLPTSLYLRDFLRASGANVYLIRETDIRITNPERAEIANLLEADLFVSIHVNAWHTPIPNGSEVHFYRQVDEYGRTEGELFGIYSEDVAERIQREMLREFNTFDRGFRNSPGLMILNRTNMPSVIVEAAFLSNPYDFQLIRSANFERRYAHAVARALIESMNAAF